MVIKYAIGFTIHLIVFTHKISRMKKRIIASFYHYMQGKGLKNITIINDQKNTSGESQADPIIEQINPDITAEQNGVSYLYKYVEGKLEDQKDMLESCYAYSQRKREHLLKLRLLVPIEHSDNVIQTLNQNHFEGVGVVRI